MWEGEIDFLWEGEGSGEPKSIKMINSIGNLIILNIILNPPPTILVSIINHPPHPLLPHCNHQG